MGLPEVYLILAAASRQLGGIFFQELAIGGVFCTSHPGRMNSIAVFSKLTLTRTLTAYPYTHGLPVHSRPTRTLTAYPYTQGLPVHHVNI